MADETSESPPLGSTVMDRGSINARIQAGQKLEPETSKPKPKEDPSFIQKLRILGLRFTRNSAPAPLDMSVEAQAVRAGKTFDARLTPDEAHQKMKENLDEFGGYKDSTPAVSKSNKVEAGRVNNPAAPPVKSNS